MQFGAHLSKLIHDNGHSVRSFAATWRPDNSESGRRNLYRYITGNQKPTARVAADLAVALGVSVETLMGDDGDDEDESFVNAVHQLTEAAAALGAMAERIEKRNRSAA